jgi:Cof subfamily protein (haloacid dehalogenase superfamily)
MSRPETAAPPTFAWLVTDLDGTLVGRDLAIVARNLDALRRYRAHGGVVVIATGRNEDSARRYHRQLGLDTPMIVYNGARVLDGDGALILDRGLGDAWPALRDQIIPGLPADTGALAFARQKVYVVKDAFALADYARRDSVELLPAPPDLADVTKVMLIGATPDVADQRARIARVDPKLTVVSSEATYLEVLAPDATKGQALTWLAHRHGVPLSRVAAIGDNPNDIDMLAAAGLGAAVADGHPRVRANADIIAAACADGAVAYLIDRVLLADERPGL